MMTTDDTDSNVISLFTDPDTLPLLTNEETVTVYQCSECGSTSFTLETDTSVQCEGCGLYTRDLRVIRNSDLIDIDINDE